MASDKVRINPLLRDGIERLSLLGRHAEVLVKAYVEGELDVAQLSSNAIDKLQQARLIYQPEADAAPVLRPALRELLASMLEDEQRRHLQTDIRERLERIEQAVLRFRAAQRQADIWRANVQQQRLTELVYDLHGQFDEAIHSLWQRLNSHFGFVASLTEKIAENQRAQGQIKRLLESLALIDFHQFIEWAEGYPKLRRLLVTQFQAQMSQHHASLLAVQDRLVGLMTRFREQQARSVLIQNMADFLRQQPNLQISQYAWRSQVPVLVNLAKPLRPAVAASLDSHAQQSNLVALLHAIPAPRSRWSTPAPSTAPARVLTTHDASVEARQQQLQTDVEQFFLTLTGTADALSALDYLAQQELKWDAEMWLYAVLAAYQGLPASQRQWFQLQRLERPVSAVNQLLIIEDVKVSYQTSTARA